MKVCQAFYSPTITIIYYVQEKYVMLENEYM